MYGSLRRSVAASMHSVLAKHCTYLAEAHMFGLLYEIDGYPGAVRSDRPEHKVYGELYAIIERAPLFLALDAYEECSCNNPKPHEYQRTPLTVIAPGQLAVTAWVYVYQYDISQRQLIVSGDYLNYLNAAN